MTVLYQIPGDMSGGPLGAAEIERRRQVLQSWASQGVVVEVADAPGGPLSIESHAEEVLCVPPMLSALQKRLPADRSGAAAPPIDAVVIGCFGDPGLAAAREILDVPVVGPFEASLHVAAQLGARAGVVTVLDSVVPVLDHLVRGMGLSVRYAGSTAVEIPVLELGRDRAQVVARAEEAGRRLISGGADVLILGCMSLSFLGVAEELARRAGVPVVNPARCALRTAELLAAQGLTQSRRTYHKPRKSVGVG